MPTIASADAPPVQDPGHGRAEIVAPSEEVPHPGRQTENPLPHRCLRPDVVHEVRGPFGHAPAAATSTPPRTVRAPGTPAGTEPASLAREGDQPLLTAAGAPEPREATREPGAPTARTLRGGVGATRTGGTPGTHPQRTEAAPRRHASTRTPRGTTRSDPARPGITPTRRGRAAQRARGHGHGLARGEPRAGTGIAGFRSPSRTTTAEMAIRAYARPGPVRNPCVQNRAASGGPARGQPRWHGRVGVRSGALCAWGANG